MDWSIYYDNDSCYFSFEGTPFDAPCRGVLVIVQEDVETGWRTVQGDYFVWHLWGWEGCDIFGLWDYLASPGPKAVKFGRTVTNEEFRRIFQRAIEEWGSKSGMLGMERKL